MGALLVFTTGQTDVQFVEDGKRFEFGKTYCALVHAELERRHDEWAIVDAPATKEERSMSDTDLPTTAFKICTPKLDAVLAYVMKKHIPLSHVLILDTQRKKVAGDPWYAGVIVAKRSKDRLGCKPSTRTLLRDDEKLVGNNDCDAVLWKSVASRIDSFVRDALSDNAIDQVLVAATGGPANTAALVEEVVRLHAGASRRRVQLLEVTDGSKMAPPAPDRAVPKAPIADPVESVRVRRYALDLINEGNLIAAWGAVGHLDIDPGGHAWKDVVHWLYFFAASLPLPPKCDLPLLKHSKMAVQAAVRVEFALKSGDIPRAILGTVAFFESAVWDRLHEKSTPDRKKDRRILKLNDPPPRGLVRRNTDDRDRPFQVIGEKHSRWYRVFDDETCMKRIVCEYLKDPVLQNLADHISGVRFLRNNVVHNQPTPELMAHAHHQMTLNGLWSGDHFLTQRLVQDVLKGLGEADPGHLCDNLIAEVRSRLLA